MPRRRLLAVVSAVAVLALCLGVVVAMVTRSGPAVTPVPQDRPGPVLLVPGYGGSTASLADLATRLVAAGHDAHVVVPPGEGTGDLREQARVLDAAARAAITRTGAASVDVVGYSAGGVVARLWVRSYGGGSLARRVITLGSPQHGTKLAGFAAAFASASCPAACVQLAPNSDLLDQLNAGDETPAGPRWVSLWTLDDETVTPPDSARLSGAVNVPLQSVCAGVHVSHGELPGSRLVQAIVLAELAAATVAPPQPVDCQGLS